MLWETAAPLSLSVLLGGKPRRNSQFGPLQGVYMCLCVIGMETSVLARDSQQWIFFSPLLWPLIITHALTNMKTGLSGLVLHQGFLARLA